MDCSRTKPKFSLMTMLPQEILVNILSRLPIKLIGRCRCVSKTWQKLLSESYFIRTHLDRTNYLPENELLIVKSVDSKTLYTASIDCQLPSEIIVSATELTLNAKPQSPSVEFSSCDGLIIIMDNDKQALLVNPATKEVRELPVPPHALGSFYRYALYGLGYDHVNDDYKVVSPSYYHTKDEFVMVVHVYSVGRGNWKEADSALYESCAIRKGTWNKVESFEYQLGYSACSTGVFVDGSIHWLATNTSNYSSFIVGFNLAEEKFLIIPAPRSVYGEDYMYDTVWELGGCLCVLNLMEGKDINIWVMKEHGVEQSWTKLSIGDGVSYCVLYLCVPGRREVVLWKDYHTEDMDLVMYNVDSATFKSITIHHVTQPCFVGSFRKTLVSPYYNHNTW